MTGLAILGSTSICATGFTFYFSDGTTQTIGTNYDEPMTVLNFVNPYGFSNVNSYAGYIIDLLQICNSFGVCVTSGNTGGSSIDFNTNINSAWNVTQFWGSLAEYGGCDCLQSFGIYGTPVISGIKFEFI